MRAQKGREPLVVGDGLDLSDHDRSGLLVNPFVTHAWILAGNLLGPEIMLTQEQGLEGRQLDILIGSNVAGRKELDAPPLLARGIGVQPDEAVQQEEICVVVVLPAAEAALDPQQADPGM